MYTISDGDKIILKTECYDEAIRAFMSQMNGGQNIGYTPADDDVEAVKEAILLFIEDESIREFRWSKVVISYNPEE